MRDVEMGVHMKVELVVARREEEVEGHHMALVVEAEEALKGHHMVLVQRCIIGTPSVGAKSFQLSNCANYGMLSYFVSV